MQEKEISPGRNAKGLFLRLIPTPSAISLDQLNYNTKKRLLQKSLASYF